MKTLNVLLAGSDRRLNNLIEATLLDVCFGQAIPSFVRVARVDEFVRQASWDGWGLIVVAADELLPRTGRSGSSITIQEAITAIGGVRSRHLSPMIAVRINAAHHAEVLQAGADQVIGVPANLDLLREHARQLLHLSPPAPEPREASRFGWLSGLARGFQRLAQI
jgi:hypothetical protein